MYRLSPTLIMTSVIVALWSMFSSLLIVPANRQRAELDLDTREKRSAVEALNQASIQPAQFTRRASELKSALSSLEGKLMPQGQTQALMEEVWRLADANSLETRAIRSPAESDSIARLNLSAAGNFAGFYQFLIQIEQMPRLIHVDRMSLRGLENADGQVQADVSLLVYLHPAAGEKNPSAPREIRRPAQASIEPAAMPADDWRRWRSTLAASDLLLLRLNRNPASAQTPLTDLKANPFRATGSLASTNTSAESAAAGRRQEDQRQETMRAVQSLQLTSIINGASRRACLINNSLYQEGQEADGFSIEQITPAAVVVRKGIYRFELRVNR